MTIDWNAPPVAPVAGKWAKQRNGKLIGPIEIKTFIKRQWAYTKATKYLAWDENGQFVFDNEFDHSSELDELRHVRDIIEILDTPE